MPNDERAGAEGEAATTDARPASPDDVIENRVFDEIAVGDTATLRRRLTFRDIKLFAAMSGDVNPAHVDEDYARSSRFHEVIAHGLWGGALISTVLGTQLPGPGTIYLGQSLRFHRPIGLGDIVEVTVAVTARDTERHHLTLDCRCTNQDGAEVISGTAQVLAPTEKIRRQRWVVPDVHLAERVHLHRLLQQAGTHPPLRAAVVHPVSAEAVALIDAARSHGLVAPILVGPEHRIRAAATACDVDLAPYELVATEHSHAAAAEAVALARQGKVDALLQGDLALRELLDAVADIDGGLRTERRISHVAAFDVPTYPRPLFITDAVLNAEPTLVDKRDIVQNAIDLARTLGIAEPRVAVLAAVATVTPRVPSTLDAAALCKMADRGQLTGGVVDGPLEYDDAVAAVVPSDEHLVSSVAGRADVLVVPDLEAGTMLAKQLEHLGGAEGAGIILGARVPIVPLERARNGLGHLASCALAVQFVHGDDGRRGGSSLGGGPGVASTVASDTQRGMTHDAPRAGVPDADDDVPEATEAGVRP